MNIDIFITEKGAVGLVCDGMLPRPVTGVLYDDSLRQLTLEDGAGGLFDLNIPVEDEIAQALSHATGIQIGVLADGEVQDNRMLPLQKAEDRNTIQRGIAAQVARSVTGFERFLKSCVAGQPVHREDLGDEGGTGSVVGGLNRAVLQFAPHLARQRTLEATHDLKMAGPAPSAPGMGMGGGGGVAVRSAPPVPPPARGTEEDGESD